MAAKPIVDGIEREHQGKLVVIRLNVHDPVGAALGARFGFRFTPTFVFFDAEGQERWRTVGSVAPSEVRRTVNEG
jgi:thioredoxin-related protein